MWSATGDPRSAAEVGRRGMRHVLVLRGVEGTKRAYQAHRQARRDAGLPPVTTDNFAYAAFVYVGDTEEEGRRVGEQIAVVPQHQPQIGAAAFALHAGHRAARGRAAGLSRRAAAAKWRRRRRT